ncbi:radical SAM protein [Paenibacillus borealis]|uniref:Radical SAM core domain-containing protein n=1 Tax=Paenibacillus borealis TaxID=160799 RepID=A0A089L681_PAEBO|nr:radical SAM protein [Paenibacillus borealis]AIQ56961.1 hypothetical protein PBOR_08475 [Paenibacillus borealis]
MNTYDQLNNRTSKRMRIYAHLSRINKKYNLKSLYIPPISMEIFPTNICNSSCKFCAFHERKGEHLDNNIFESVVESCIEMGVKSVTISGGGEPTLHQYLPIAINKLVTHGIQVGLITNGVHFSEELEKTINKCSWVRVSLLAGNADQYCRYMKFNREQFDKVIGNLSRLADSKQNMILGTTMMLSSEYGDYNSIIEYLDVVSKLKVDQVFFTEMLDDFGEFKMNKDYYRSIIDSVIQHAEKRNIVTNIRKFTQVESQPYIDKVPNEKCSIIEKNLIGLVVPDGRVFSCLGQYTAIDNDRSLGNVNDQDLTKIYNPANLNEKNQLICENVCSYCKNASTRMELDRYFCSKKVKKVNDPHHMFI